MAPQTLAQKLIARAAGRQDVTPGEGVTVAVDLLMAHDSSGPRRWRPRLEELGTGLWDPSRVVVVTDHFVPATDSAAAAILAETRRFVEDYGVEHFFDMQGICHAILPERGLLRPGLFVAGGDSHTPMAGAFGCFAAGFGATDTTAIAVTGRTWTNVPESIRVEIDGRLGEGVSAKDVMLVLCRDLGMENAFKAIEYTGSAVEAMSMQERMVLTNMAAELGGEAGLVPVEAVTLDYLRERGVEVSDDDLAWRSDPGATYAREFRLDADGLTPQIAAPHSPANTEDLAAFAGQKVDQCYIGACVGAKLQDLQAAAKVLNGRKVARTTRLLVAPSTGRTLQQATADGTLAILMEAGAVLLPSGCGACAGLGAGILAEGEVCLSSTNRNFRGRMGHPKSSVYLGSPYSVAAAAVTGEITDPRDLLLMKEAS